MMGYIFITTVIFTKWSISIGHWSYQPKKASWKVLTGANTLAYFFATQQIKKNIL
jgi:hypothetical protein